MNKSWYGLVKILEIQHVRDNKVIWEDKNILNTLHVGGELFILSCAFDNDGTLPPANYYFGLDNRATVSVDDTMSEIEDEPVGNGYLRAAVSSSGQFTTELIGGAFRATSQILTFTATGLGWGPVSNLFLSSTSDNSGILIATTQLSVPVTLASGDALNLRMGLSLQDIE